jgi:ribonuclease Z
MFEIVFLGTSASAPSIHRGLSSQMVLHEARRFLVDCGEGTQRQIMRSGMGFKRIDTILLTHGHLDHILGLAGLVSTFARWEALEKLEIWGGPRTLERVHDLLFKVVLRGARPPLDIQLREVEPGVLVEDRRFTLTAFPVVHRAPDCFGYLFEEKSRRPFLNDVAEELGVPPGPERRELVEGNAITLADGRVVTPDEVLGPEIPGTRLVHVGDAGRVDELRPIVQGADALVIEATYLEVEAELARNFSHLTAHQAGRLAAEAGVGNLLLTHLSRRYRERDVLAEANAAFPGAVVARDFDHYQIRRGEPLVKVLDD